MHEYSSKRALVLVLRVLLGPRRSSSSATRYRGSQPPDPLPEGNFEAIISIILIPGDGDWAGTQTTSCTWPNELMAWKIPSGSGRGGCRPHQPRHSTARPPPFLKTSGVVTAADPSLEGTDDITVTVAGGRSRLCVMMR